MRPHNILLAALPVSLLAVGCYSPSPAAGSYRCSTAGDSCPTGQHCTCGLCVKSDDQAACSFSLQASLPADGTVGEHEQFSLSVQALGPDGAPAGHFNGTVTLSSSWGDVSPASMSLVDGQAVQMVALNRETLPPQTATLTASFAGNKGTVGHIGVKAQPFVRDPTAIVPPPTGQQTFGFADTVVAEPDVIVDNGAYRMYFGGYAMSQQFKGYDFGVATSSDGVHFTPNPVPVFRAPTTPMNAQINSPSAFLAGDGNWYLAYSLGANGVIDQQDAYLAGPTSDGMSTFPPIGPVVSRTDCAYCDGTVELPSVIADPSGNGYIMFFSATHKVTTPSGTSTVAEIGRATSSDGQHFVAEPAPLLSSDITGELVLLSPRVIVDGTVYKMWYSYARAADIKDLTDLCNAMNQIQIGYATSSDGFYWIRSPSNPAVAVGGSGWDADSHALLVGSVVPLDGKSASSGFALYYTTFRTVSVFNVCLPSGIGRATRP